jgi:hypothetical protein
MFFSALHMEQFLCAWAEADRSRRQVHSVLRAELASLPATATPSIRPVQALVYLPAALLADVVRACMGPIIVVLEEKNSPPPHALSSPRLNAARKPNGQTNLAHLATEDSAGPEQQLGTS